MIFKPSVILVTLMIFVVSIVQCADISDGNGGINSVFA